jgi:hypothetical protein
MRRIVAWAVAAVCIINIGCYLERPLTVTPPPPATRIIAQLTDSGTVALSNFIGAGALEVEGVVSAADANSWTLQMIRVDHRDGRTINWNREAVSVRPSLLMNPTVRSLDKKRSWLAAAGITIVAILAAQAFDLLGSPDDEPEPPPPPASLIPDGGR